MPSHMLSMKRCLAVVVACLLLTAAVSSSSAQEQVVTLEGRVQWIAGEKMMLIPDTGGPPIEIDITQLALDDYRTLTEGDPVIVRGVVSPDGRKLIATSIKSPNG